MPPVGPIGGFHFDLPTMRKRKVRKTSIHNRGGARRLSRSSGNVDQAGHNGTQTANDRACDLPLPADLAELFPDEDVDGQRVADELRMSPSGDPLVRVFDPAAASVACGPEVDDPTEAQQERDKLLREMSTDAADGYRQFIVPTVQQVAALRLLETAAPHLAAVVDIVADAAEAAMRRGTGFYCPPLLIVGPPGIGKTWLIRKMANALALPLIFLDGSAMDDTAMLGGHSRSWRASRPGAVATQLVKGDVANPILVIDEIDKADGDHHCGPTIWHVLHGMLEQETARHWADSCLEIRTDVSRLVFVATANETGFLAPSLLDRLLVITVDGPDGDNIASLVQAVSAGVAAGFNVRNTPLAADTLPFLADLPPRRLRTILTLAWARALAAGQDRPEVPEIRRAASLIDTAKRTRIGFLTER